MLPDAMAFLNGEREFTDEGRLRNVRMHIIVEPKRGGGELLAKFKEEKRYGNSST